jgi:hypothetical protein
VPKEFEIAKEIELEATPEQVWETIATEAGLAAWFYPTPVDPTSDMVVAWEPGRRLAIRTPEAEDGTMHAFEYRIETRPGGTAVLRFVHSGFLGEDWSDEYPSMTSAGWDMYLYTLSQYHTHFGGRRAVYVGAEGPPPSSRPQAWAALAKALAPEGPVAIGSPIRIHLDGVAPLDGAVDYLTPNYVGLRTSDALIRFHGRSSLGMTVAVSHHDYSSRVDPQATSKAWESWLAGVFSTA